MTTSDNSQRFIFEKTDIRGERVHLESSYQSAILNTTYPDCVQKLLGEALSAAVLLSSTIKFSGKLILQLQGNGPITLIVVEADNNRNIRGIIKHQTIADELTFQQLVGDAKLVITIEPDEGKRYQGIVPLVGEQLSECLEHYFEQSEQLPTKIWLAANLEKSAGFLLQKLPESDNTDESKSWEHITIIAKTTTNEELLDLSNEDFLYRLFHAEEVRLFTPQSIQFQCSCSLERCKGSIISLGESEINKIIKEQGQVNMTCEFCNSQYHLNQDDLMTLLKESSENKKR